MNASSTQIPLEEITQYQKQLVDNPTALADLDVIKNCGGDLQQSVRVLARRAGVEEIKSGSSWQVALQKAREIVCDQNFKDGLLPEVIGGLVAIFTASGGSILSAVATPISIYIAQVGIDNFCESSRSSSNNEDENL